MKKSTRIIPIHRGKTTEFVCPNCGKEIPVTRSDGQSNRAAISQHVGRCPRTIEELAELVGAKIGSKRQCWIPSSGSYGNARAKHAHVVAYELTNGPVPKGMVVCHTCDVFNCINPSHLWIGTQADNLHDMFGKDRGRGQIAKGGGGRGQITKRRLR